MGSDGEEETKKEEPALTLTLNLNLILTLNLTLTPTLTLTLTLGGKLKDAFPSLCDDDDVLYAEDLLSFSY